MDIFSVRQAKCKKRKDCKVSSRHADGQQRQEEEANKTFLCNTLKRVLFYFQVTTNTSKAEQELQNLTLITNRSQLNVTILWFTVLAIFELTGLTESEPNSLATKSGSSNSLTHNKPQNLLDLLMAEFPLLSSCFCLQLFHSMDWKMWSHTKTNDVRVTTDSNVVVDDVVSRCFEARDRR